MLNTMIMVKGLSTTMLKAKAFSTYALFSLLIFFQSSDLETLATNIQDLLQLVVLVGTPVLLAAGFVMITFGGMNPQWKQRGIETIKWTIIGAIGLVIGVGALQAFIASAGGGGGGGT